MDAFGIAMVSIWLTLFLYLYTKVKKIYSYFEDRGIPYVPAVFPFGSDIQNSLMLSHFCETNEKMYQKLRNHKVGGVFKYLQPFYLIVDPEYANRILVNDFSYFHDRGISIDEETNPLDGNLVFLSGQKWKYLRQKLSPIFTTGKLRWMYDEMYKCGETFISHFARHDGKDVDIKDDLGCLTTDVIGSTAFGIDIDSIKNPDSEFRTMGKRAFNLSAYESLMASGRFLFPEIERKLKIKTIPSPVSEFFLSMTKQSFENRLSNGIDRRDIVQLLLELKLKGSVKIDAQDRDELMEKDEEFDKTFEFTDELLAAQCFVFFGAGFETTATTMYFMLYLLSKYPECQAKAREEIRKVKIKYNGKFEFDGLKELEYVGNCISETLRMYPPLPFLSRTCVKDYTFPDGTKIEKGFTVMVPSFSIQRDPENFPDPDVYNPDRFNQPPKAGTYSPFGIGPRMCIAKRFAFTELKMATAKILDAFSIEKSELTKEPIGFKPTSFTLFPTNPLYVKIKKL